MNLKPNGDPVDVSSNVEHLNVCMGSDPELFVFDKKLDKIVPACGLVPGTKTDPFELNNGTVQLDGTLVEIGPKPAKTLEEFIQYTKGLLQEVQAILGDRYELRCGATAEYSPEDIESLPVGALDVGCDPQYSLRYNSLRCIELRPEQGIVTAGGHLHLGWTEGQKLFDSVHLTDCYEVTRTLNSLMNGYTGSLCGKEVRRCKIQGAEGHGTHFVVRQFTPIRVKPYGVEFRKFSSYWLASEACLTYMWRSYMETLFYITGNDKFSRNPNPNCASEVCRAVDGLESKYQGTLPVFCSDQEL